MFRGWKPGMKSNDESYRQKMLPNESQIRWRKCCCSIENNSIENNSIEESCDVTSGLLPVLSDVKKYNPKKIFRTKRFVVKFQGESLGVFFAYDSILWLLSSILSATVKIRPNIYFESGTYIKAFEENFDFI